MNEKKVLLISKIAKLVAVILLLACFLVPLAPALHMEGKDYGNTYQFIFGGTISYGVVTYKAIGLSGLGLAYFIIALVSVIALVLSYFLAKKNNVLSKCLTFGSSLSAIAFSVMSLCSHQSFANVLADTLLKGHSDIVSKTIYENSSLTFGAFGIAIFGFLAALCILTSLLFDGTFDQVRRKIGLI